MIALHYVRRLVNNLLFCVPGPGTLVPLLFFRKYRFAFIEFFFLTLPRSIKNQDTGIWLHWEHLFYWGEEIDQELKCQMKEISGGGIQGRFPDI